MFMTLIQRKNNIVHVYSAQQEPINMLLDYGARSRQRASWLQRPSFPRVIETINPVPRRQRI